MDTPRFGSFSALLLTNVSCLASLSLLMVFVNRLLGLNMLKLKKKNRLMSSTEK